MSSPDPDPMTSKPVTSSTRIRRWPVLIAAVLVVAGAIAVSQVKPEKSVPFSSGPISSSAAVIAAPRALSTAWYCAEGSSDIEGRASETVIIGNLEKRPVSATVSVMTGDKATDVTRQLKIAAYGQKRIEVADLVEATNVGVVVEIFDGRAVVEHEIVSETISRLVLVRLEQILDGISPIFLLIDRLKVGLRCLTPLVMMQ